MLFRYNTLGPSFALDHSEMIRTASRQMETTVGQGSRLAILGIVIAFTVLYLITGPDATGDTPVYVGDILRYVHTGTPPPTFWDFGHLLWRPLGFGLWHVAEPLARPVFGDSPVIELTGILFAVNFASGLLLAILTFLICRRLGLNDGLACGLSLAILLCNAVLNYVHSGCSYIPGVAAQFAGFWLVLKALQDPARRTVCCIGAGIALSLSFALWFPFCLGVPAALALALWGNEGDERYSKVEASARIQIVLRVAAVIAVSALVVFSFGAVMAHVSSYSALKDWIANSGHGVHPERRLLRFPTGITRTFFFLGDEGITIKRFVFHDPYAPVKWLGLLSAGLWKVALVFASFAVLAWRLWQTGAGRRALLVTLSGVVPTLLFAVLLFETGQSERYLPLYAALLVGICAAFAQRVHGQAIRWLFAVFTLLLLVVNLKAYAVDLRNTAKQSSERMALVHQRTQHGGVALLLSFRDPVSTYFQRSPFDPANRFGALSLYHVIEQERGDVGDWRTQSACRVLRAWREGGEAWVSKRLEAVRPEPDWGWVEHDVQGLSWSDLTSFFGQFDTNADIGGPDGFVRLTTSIKNEELLRRTCGS